METGKRSAGKRAGTEGRLFRRGGPGTGWDWIPRCILYLPEKHPERAFPYQSKGTQRRDRGCHWGHRMRKDYFGRTDDAILWCGFRRGLCGRGWCQKIPATGAPGENSYSHAKKRAVWHDSGGKHCLGAAGSG